MDRRNQEGTRLLEQVVGDDPAKFVESQREKIADDLRAIWRQVHPGRELPDDVIEKVLNELSSRLEKAVEGRLLPKITQRGIQFQAESAGGWGASWGQARSLVAAIARYPRESHTNRFFFQGLRIDPDQLRSAMNVCDDHFLRKDSRRGDPVKTAKAQLDQLQGIVDAQAEERSKCRAVFALIDGKSQEEIDSSLRSSDPARGRASAPAPKSGERREG
jgi:hypothetical protein